MGFTVVPLAQKARTQTLIADSDLNLGNYDLIATDVKGDTAEFTEFVGGVGNFSNVLGSGNLDIEGTGNIKGLTTFQNAVQVNGALHVEGSINNVNIADNGEITTAQGVNGADFNGAKITSTKFNGATINTSGDYSGRKGTFSGEVSGTTGTFSGAVTGANFNGVVLKSSGIITVTPTNTLKGYIPAHRTDSTDDTCILTLLPPNLNGLNYSGSIKLKNTNTSSNRAISYENGVNIRATEIVINANSDYTLSFTNIPYLLLWFQATSATVGTEHPKYYGFNLS